MPLSGTQWTVILNGTAVILGALWFFSKRPALRAVIRPIYEEMGIIPTKEELAAEQVEAS